ncbi:hypothetical protein B0H10DRAFT_1957710 [Mycena sp. CBHHK59/15]|nr:hypothetical protein B0H10DRAFT_1957710 [Mycena sp. CBHHK59/15]
MANIRTSVTKFGHLGALIAGEYWDTVMSELLQSQRTLTQLEAEYQGLPAMLLSPSELLPLKPQHLLNSTEHSALVALYGWSENPIAKYFSQHRFSKPCSRIDQSKLSLTFRMQNRVLCGPLCVLPSSVSLHERKRNAQKRKDTMFDPLYLLESEIVKREYTIKFIKEKTKGWTVGPCDFVGMDDRFIMAVQRSLVYASGLGLIRMVSADGLAYYCFNIVHLLDGMYK